MEKNKRLNPRNIFEKPIYRSIIRILSTHEKSKVKFSHLKYALVDKDYNRIINKMEKFYSQPTDEVLNLKKTLKNEFEKGKLNQEFYSALTNAIEINSIEKLLDGYLSKEDKLFSESSLRDKLYELTDLGLIEKISDKKGYPYYLLTDLGKIQYDRWNVHRLIDLNIADSELSELNKMIISSLFKKRGVSLR